MNFENGREEQMYPDVKNVESNGDWGCIVAFQFAV